MNDIYHAAYPLIREAWIVRALCCLKIDPLRCYAIFRLAANDMPQLTPKLLADEACVTEASARQVLRLMKADGTVTRDLNGGYHLTIPKGARKFYSVVHVSTRRPVPDGVAYLDAPPKQFFDWAGMCRIKGKRQKKDSWAMRNLRDLIQRSSPEEFRDLLREYGMKPIRESSTAKRPGHKNEDRWKKERKTD